MSAPTVLRKIIVLEINNSIYTDGIYDTTLELIRRMNQDFPNCAVEYHGLIENEEKLGHSFIYYSDVVQCDVIMTIGGVGFMSKSIITEASYRIIEKNVTEKMSSMVSAQPELGEILTFAGVRGRTLILNFPWFPEIVTKYMDTIQPVLASLYEMAINENRTVELPECNSIVEFSPSKLNNHKEYYYSIIDVSEAIGVIENIFKRNSVRTFTKIPVGYAYGFVCAEPIFSEAIIPPMDIAAKEGYACYYEDGLNERTITKKTIQYSGSDKLPHNGCYYIQKGEPMLNETNCIIEMKHIDIVKGKKKNKINMKPLRAPGAIYENVKQMGSIIKMGELIISEGVMIRELETSLLTAVQREKVTIYTKPSVGILSVGNGLSLYTDFQLNNVHIREFSVVKIKDLFLLHSMICNDYGLVIKSPIAITEGLDKALKINDIIIVTVRDTTDDMDYFRSIMFEKYNMDIVFEHVNMTPGENTKFATCLFNSKRKYFFIISGNMVSALTSCHVVVIPTLIYWSGINNFGFTVLSVCTEDDIPLQSKPQYLFANIVHNVNSSYASVRLMKEIQFINGLPDYDFDVVLEIPRISEYRSVFKRGSLCNAFLLPKI